MTRPNHDLSTLEPGHTGLTEPPAGARSTRRVRMTLPVTKRRARLMRRQRRGFKLGNHGQPAGAEYQAFLERCRLEVR